MSINRDVHLLSSLPKTGRAQHDQQTCDDQRDSSARLDSSNFVLTSAGQPKGHGHREIPSHRLEITRYSVSPLLSFLGQLFLKRSYCSEVYGSLGRSERIIGDLIRETDEETRSRSYIANEMSVLHRLR